MSLTGPVLAWTTTAAAVVASAAVIWWWPLLGGRWGRAANLAVRGGVLLGIDLLVLLTVAIQLNDQFLFFADWSDLNGALGGTTAVPAPRLSGAPVPGTVPVAVPVRGDQVPASRADGAQPLPPGSPGPGGSVIYRVTGPLSGVTGQILVSLPAGYDRQPARRFPVLETFSGYPGAITQWMRTMRLRSVASGQVAAHRLAPVVIVSPQLEIPAGADTECVDGAPGRPAVETWLTRDVPGWVAAHFRVVPGPQSWATIGLSAGGWCAAMATMLHPDQFGAAVVLGGYFRPEFGPDVPYPPGSPLAARYDLVALAERTPPPVALWVQTSRVDSLSYPTSSVLLRTARAPLSVTATVLPKAGHRMDVWQHLTPSALAWLGSILPGFHP